MARHPTAEQIRGFLDSQGPRCSHSTALHLVQCRQCRAAVIGELGKDSAGSGLLARVLPHPAKWTPRGEAKEAQERMLGRLSRAADEVAAGPMLLAELRRHSLDRWPLLLQNSERFHSLALAREILEAGYAEAFDDPAAGAAIIHVGLDLVQLLDEGYYGERLVADLRARGWALVADCCRMTGDLKAAEAAFRRAGRFIKDTTDPEELAKYKYLLGLLAKDQRRYQRAFGLFQRARELSEEIGDRDKLARVLNSIGTLRREVGEPEEALPLLLEASALVEELEDRRLALFVRSNLSLCLVDLGDFRGASEIFERCRAQYETTKESYVRLRARWLEGRIAAGLSDAERGEALLASARAEYLERRQHYNAALVSLDLAALYARQGRSVELKALAEEMATVFVAQDVPAEAIAALAFFRQAVEQERATEELVGGVARFLQRARTEPGVRFNRRR